MLVNQGPSLTDGTAHGQCVESAARAVLEKISELAARQRAAIVAHDVRTLNRLFDPLLRLHADLGSLMSEQPEPTGTFEGSLHLMATQVRQQLRFNQALLANGAAMTDRFMALLGASTEPGVPASGAMRGPMESGASAAALFSGVA